MDLIPKKKNKGKKDYFLQKRWIIGLVVCCFVLGCKSTDCGCPMAIIDKSEIEQQKINAFSEPMYWKKTLKDK